jgi:Flp pilus assembly protein TadD
MHKSLASLAMSLAGAAAIAAMPALAASSASASPVSADQMVAAPQQTATPIKKTGAKRERHPEIRKAIAALERAKYDLNHANHDFGGHRADALAATDKAIEQLKLALQYDKR